jgi:glycolate oxidase FAD binding subunit
VEELGAVIRKAGGEGRAVYPVGGGTMLDRGYIPPKPGYAVLMNGLDKVIDYPARDMTITVQAGITISRLREILSRENQWLPIDVPQPDSATLGGAMAVNASGPRRLGHGTFRDYVIGIQFMDDAGNEVKAGGRVVKNVAGYDLMKLQIGAFGTLGIITQVTLKVKPKPECSSVVVTRCYAEELDRLLKRMDSTQTRPVSLDVLTTATCAMFNAGRQEPLFPYNFGSLHVIYGFDGAREAIDWSYYQLNHELPDEQEKMAHGHRDDMATPYFDAMTDFATRSDACLIFHANLLPAALPAFVERIGGLNPTPAIVARAGSGIVIGHFPAGMTLEQVEPILTELRARAVQAQGNLVVTRCPDEWKSRLPIWGERRGDWALMRTIKQTLDPRGLFNPGRYVDEI